MPRKFAYLLYNLVGFLAVLVLLGFGASSARAQVQLTSFQLLTAPHAALGAPVQWSFTIVNNGATTATVTESVTLTAPDGTSYSAYSAVINVTAGVSKNVTRALISSTFTSQTGSFQVIAKLTQSGTVLGTQTIPITITAAPSTGAYTSVGGMGPATALFGAPLTYKIVASNLGAASKSLITNSYLNMPDGTQKTIGLGTATTITAGSYTLTQKTINPSVWNNANPGNYSILVNLLDSNGNILATDTYTLVRNALAATSYYPTFTDNATTAGLTLNRMGMNIPKGCSTGSSDYMMGGSGVAIADYDGDGYDDIYMIDMMGMGVLYHNNHDGTFTDKTAEAGIPMVMMQSGAVWGDIDNDGHPDLLILTNPQLLTNMPPVLLHNNGPNASGVVTFTDISSTSGIPAAIGATQNLQSATFGDYDGDGFLDLYITAHLDCNLTNDNGHLFHNNGNLTFTDRTDLLGGSTATAVNKRGLVTTFVDYNKDGKIDLYTGNDVSTGNVLWRNDGPGGSLGWILTDVSSSSSAGVKMSDMGIAVGDYNRDGNFDLFLTNVGSNILLQGQSGGVFLTQASSDINGAHVERKDVPLTLAGKAGMTAGVTWGVGAYDFNNDGWEDLFYAGGPISTGGNLYYNALFLNSQDGTFLDLSPLAGTLGNGMDPMPNAVFADFNHDGFMDILTMGMMGTAHLYMNNARSNGNPYNWLQVKLIGGCTSAGGCTGTFTNRDAIGARFVANVGSAQLWRTVVDGGAPGGNSTLVQHLGLGAATQVDSLTVYWPSGKMSTLSNIAANQKITIQEQ